MPKFFYSVILALLMSCGTLVYLILEDPAGTYKSIFLFIFALFMALTFLLSIPIYLFLKKKNPTFSNDNVQYKKGLKYASFIAFGVAGLAFLRAFRIVSLLNVGLFMLLYLGIFYQLKSKR